MAARPTFVRRSTRALGAVLLLLAAAGCGGVRPYRAMARAATSEENVLAQADDRRLGLRLHEALIAAGFVTGVKPFVYMGHAYLVGFVDDEEARARALSAAGQVAGIRSVDGYLPVSTGAGRGIERSADDLRLQGEVKAAIGIDRDERMTRVDVDVLAGHALLLGVVSSPEAVAAVAETAGGVPGITGVTNFLLLPEAGYERLRPGM
jgi:osmotically-inducible protein OsmY